MLEMQKLEMQLWELRWAAQNRLRRAGLVLPPQMLRGAEITR